MRTEQRGTGAAVTAPGGAEDDRPALAASVMVGSLALLALQDALVKITSAEVSLWQFQLLRSVFNLALLALVVLVFGQGMPTWPRRLWAVGLRSGLLVASMVFFFGAVPFLQLSEIAAGLYVFPLFVAVLSVVFLGERVGPRRILAVLAGFAGTLLILKPGTEAFRWEGLMPVLAGLLYAATVLTTRKACRQENPVTLATGVSVVFICVGIAGLVLAPLAPVRLAEAWPYLFTGWHPVGLVVVGVVIACSGLNLTSNIGLAKAYQSAESSWLAPFDYSYLVFASFWGLVLFGHVPDAVSAVGMAMIAGSGCYVAWRERQESRLKRADLNRALR